MPLIENNNNPLFIFERFLKLSIPITLLWILLFIMGFHLQLNIVAELLRFSDRLFYKDWWNCKSIGEYWRLWNLPVHHWLMRHVYFVLLKKGYPKTLALVFVFIISAIFHEYVISASIGVWSYFAFLAMMS